MNFFIQEIYSNYNSVSLNILRLDEIHPLIQGNKYYKLIFNIEYAIQHNLSVVTFGGAYSNHIHATALACKKFNIPCYGIIRGTNFKFKSSTLQKAEDSGMNMLYTDRATFKHLRTISNKDIKHWLSTFHHIDRNLHIIPEGGTNELGIKGAEQIINEIDSDFDAIICPVGTGGTLTGIINSLRGEKQVIGISSLKDPYLNDEVKKMLHKEYTNWEINYDYHFGGYAKWNLELIAFINKFKTQHNIPLCPIYTGKMMYGIFDLIQKKYFKANTKILAIHTGGLQGIEGFNLANKNLLI